MTSLHFPAKILLFGEHTVLRGSRALARPFDRFYGRWAFGEAEQQQRLMDWTTYLADHFSENVLDSKRFQTELREGLFFDSNIPTGYGLGSSGALCAAAFERYASDDAKSLETAELRRVLGRMESFFHGSSSGTDPLISYLQRPVCLYPDAPPQAVQLPELTGDYHFFLLDTGQTRQTGPLVQTFTTLFDTDTDFRRAVNHEWIPATEAAITACLAGDGAGVWEAFTAISTFQWTHLPPTFLTDNLQQAWRNGLAGNDYRLKICGAGGGGFVLGYARAEVVLGEVIRI